MTNTVELNTSDLTRYLVRISYAGLTERLTVIAVSPAEAARSALTARADHRPSLLSVEVAS